MATKYDILIIWGWVSWTALLYTLSKFTDVKRIALLEKYSNVGLVNSKASNNSQTLHCWDIETNYNLEKATKVKKKADMLKYFVEDFAQRYPDSQIFSKYNKMVLAVGEKQVKELAKRYEDFKELFPTLRKIDREEIARLEPKVVEGRDPKESILALSSPEWYTIDYGQVSESFITEAKLQHDKHIDLYFDALVSSIKKTDSGYQVITQSWEVFEANVVAVCAGGHSPLIAKSLGYAKDFSILSVAGSFFKSPLGLLNGKVYTMQIEKLPFAAIHGDPDVHNQSETRFGPTAKGIFMLERYNYSSVREYFKVFGFRLRAFRVIIKLFLDPIVSPYLFINFLYDLPYIGKRLFLREIRKIIPTITADQIHHADWVGGTRPQILNLKTLELEMGEAKIIWDNILFNITPSPGASTCLGNAYEEVQTIMWFFGGRFSFDKKGFEKAFIK